MYVPLHSWKTRETSTTERGLGGTDARISTYKCECELSQLLSLQKGTLLSSHSFLCIAWALKKRECLNWIFINMEKPLEFLDRDLGCRKIGVHLSAGSDTSLHLLKIYLVFLRIWIIDKGKLHPYLKSANLI